MSQTIEIKGFSDVAKELYPWASPQRLPLAEYQKALFLQARLTPPVAEAFKKAEQIRQKTRAIVYIAGALTGVDEETKQRYEKVSEFLSTCDGLFFGYAPHLHGTDPVKHPDITPREVRDVDNLWADAISDLHINFLDPLAHGNAIEEGWAEKRMIPTVYVAPKDMQLSRLTRGMENVSRTILYDDFGTDGLEQLKIFFDEFAAWLNYYPSRDPREFLYFSLTAVDKLTQLLQTDLKEDGTYPMDDDIAVFVSNPDLPDYGKVGKLRSHYVDFWSWYEVDIGDHKVPFSNNDFSVWVNPELEIESQLQVKGLKKLQFSMVRGS